MTKIIAKIVKDEAGSPSLVEITKDGRTINIKYDPDQQLEIEGQAGLMPNFAEIMQLIYPSSVTIQRIEEIGTLENIVTPAKIKAATEGFCFTELWESETFDQEKYIGRTGPFFKSEANLPRDQWTSPKTVGSGWGYTYLDMRNSIDGKTLDELYYAIPLGFKKAKMRFDAKIPAPKTGYFLFIGFEVIAAGGHAIACLHVGSVNTELMIILFKKDGTTATASQVVTLTSTAMATYQLIWDGITLTLSEFVGGAWTANNSVTIGADALHGDYFVPFFANESTVITDVGAFQIGWTQVWRFDKPYPSTPAIYNVTMTNANQEYSQVLPAGTRKFRIKERLGLDFRLAFVTGKVATPTAPYYTACTTRDSANNWNVGPYELVFNNIECAALTCYFASAGSGRTIEIIAWT